MKNGFTLAELLGVIAILGIIAMITVPVIDRSLDQGRSNLSKAQVKQLEKGLEDYYAEHIRELPKNIGDRKCMKINDLQNKGYLPLDIKNPSKIDESESYTIEEIIDKMKTITKDNEEIISKLEGLLKW